MGDDDDDDDDVIGEGRECGGEVGRLIVGVEHAGGRSTSAVVDAVPAKAFMHKAQRRRA